uniref:Glutathione transferase n=1 Tax=Aureoumbra lagunensis TaxID=44058 RepID=A0A7S3K6P8_9STRA|mmetsp:Transcript_1406/g.1834  ORF Transcript_1406/g.1834 Transcript_1406/m.1834 type:complete len:243 (-) Transcript_1406:159-887(-)
MKRDRYIVHYLAARARAEPIHLLLHYADVDYERHDLSMKELASGERGKQFPSSQLPVLEILTRDERPCISQSGSIMRYLAREHGLVANDPVEAARQDAVFELSQEFAKVNPMVNLWPKSELAIQEFLNKGCGNGSGYPVQPRLQAASQLLGENKFFSGNDVEPCYADFNMWHYLDNLDSLIPDILKSMSTSKQDLSNLSDWMLRIAQLPGVAQYLSTRPRGTDLGKTGTIIQESYKRHKPWD